MFERWRVGEEGFEGCGFVGVLLSADEGVQLGELRGVAVVEHAEKELLLRGERERWRGVAGRVEVGDGLGVEIAAWSLLYSGLGFQTISKYRGPSTAPLRGFAQDDGVSFW